MLTHWAMILVSGRFIPVQRCGRCLIVLGRTARSGHQCVSLCTYNDRFHLFPKDFQPTPRAI